MAALAIGRAWVVDCSRCANEGMSFEEDATAARAELDAAGWVNDDGDHYCPACVGGSFKWPPA